MTSLAAARAGLILIQVEIENVTSQDSTGRTATRRTVLGGVAGGLATALLGTHSGLALQATPGSTPSTTDGVQPDGTWAFTDDRPVTVTAPETPSRIVAQTNAGAALYDFGIEIAGIYGPSTTPDGSPDFEAGNLPLDEIVVLGDYGTDTLEMDIEKFVELDPDLVVDQLVYEDTFWYLVGDARARVEELGVPIVAISMSSVSLLTIIERYEDLAAALGADLDAPKVTEAKAAHAKSEEALKAAIAAKPGLSVLVISPTPDSVYIASPRYMTDLRYYADLGLDVVDHQTDDYFEQLSWEEINRYPADVILIDARQASLQADGLSTTIPIWNTLPAVQAGQVGAWYAAAPSSYSRLVPIMDELTALISASDPGVV